MVGRLNADFVVTAINNVIARAVSDGVLVAQFVTNVLEGLVKVVHMVREKSTAPGFFRQILQNLITRREVVLTIGGLGWIGLRKRDPLRAGADGVNHHAGALGHFDGFGAGVIREIVFAVAD